MSSDPLNLFTPYRRREPNHEDQLARALLVVLRLSPLAHAAWLRLVDDDVELPRMPVAEFRTQQRKVRHASDDEEPVELRSVYLAPDAPLDRDAVVAESDRAQVLDAVIEYGGELIVVVENKVAEDTDWQALNINTAGSRVLEIDGQSVIYVEWRELLERLMGLLDQGWVTGAEAVVLDEFLTYTENHFPDLGPFRTLRLTQGHRGRQSRRLRQLLGEATGQQAHINVYGPHIDTPAGDRIGTQAYLRIAEDGEQVELALFPADTLSQARSFYGASEALEGLLALCAEPGWDLSPNFHFGHMQRGYVWTDTTLPVGDYVRLWAREIAGTRAVPDDEWDAYWAWLMENGIATDEDRHEFDRHFTNTNRTKAFPRPGLALARRWPSTKPKPWTREANSPTRCATLSTRRSPRAGNRRWSERTLAVKRGEARPLKAWASP